MHSDAVCRIKKIEFLCKQGCDVHQDNDTRFFNLLHFICGWVIEELFNSPIDRQPATDECPVDREAVNRYRGFAMAFLLFCPHFQTLLRRRWNDSIGTAINRPMNKVR